MAEALTSFRPWADFSSVAAQLKLRARKLWRAYPRETIGAGVLGLVAAATIGSALAPTTGAHAAPPAPPPLLMRDLAPAQALKVNAEIPVVGGANPAAAPFDFKGSSAIRQQALTCLASAVFYEAGSQDDNGERAVAQVVLNRVRHPAFPGTVCGVVYEGSTRATGCQFTFTCDGSLYRQPDAIGWRRAYKIADAALNGYVYAPVGWATHYHADYVVPYWASTLAKNAVVGAHIFYHWAGEWGQPAIFSKAYAGREPNAVGLRNAALAAEAATVGQGQSVAQAIDRIPGAEEIKLAPSLRGDKRVAVRFNLTARKASDGAVHEDYVRKFEASDNLKYALSTETTASDEKPLGKAPEVADPAGSAAARP
jgi:spore germination cell wall hydrolase CwlJ-like protein